MAVIDPDDSSDERFNDNDGFEITEPLCNSCWHKQEGLLACQAFPRGIPVGILTGVIDHHENVEGDGGIKYQAKK